MKVVRQGVFETNSSSSHSLSIEYIDSNNSYFGMLPRVPKEQPSECIDIQSVPLKQEDYATTEIDKLRIIVSLITEMIYYEFTEPLRAEWEAKNPNKKYNWNEYYEYFGKKTKQKGTINYVLGHKYWGYLNSVLKKHCNVYIQPYIKKNYFPFVSDFVDCDLGCETNKYYSDVGLRLNMDRNAFKSIVEDIIFSPNKAIDQYTSERM